MNDKDIGKFCEISRASDPNAPSLTGNSENLTSKFFLSRRSREIAQRRQNKSQGQPRHHK